MSPVFLLVVLVGCALHKPWETAYSGGQPVVIEPGEGAGNVRLGMRMGQVERRLGEPVLVEPFPTQDATYWTWPEHGLSVQFTGRRLESMFFYSGIRGGFESKDFKTFPGRMANGISPYSTVAQVRGTMGDPDTTGELSEAPIPARWFTYNEGISFTFLAAGDKMVYMNVIER